MSRDAPGEPRWLAGALRELAERDAAESAPPHVERSLREAFRVAAARRRRRPRAAWWLGAAAAALAVWSVVAPPAPSPGAADPDGEGGAFFPLVEGDPLAELDAVQVVRVRLPGSALARLGGGPALAGEETVDAQVILGQDGVARAIRFVE